MALNPTNIPTHVRAYVYRVLTGVGAIALFYGKVSGEELVVWLSLVATVLGTGLAAANTPTSRS